MRDKTKLLHERALLTCIIMLFLCIILKLFGIPWFDLNTDSSIERNIDAVRAENFKNTCDITTAIHAEGEATRALINANTMQDLRDRLEAKDRDLLTANFQLSQQAQSQNIINSLRPVPTPAYLTCSPYFAYNYGGCGCGCNGNFNI